MNGISNNGSKRIKDLVQVLYGSKNVFLLMMNNSRQSSSHFLNRTFKQQTTTQDHNSNSNIKINYKVQHHHDKEEESEIEQPKKRVEKVVEEEEEDHHKFLTNSNPTLTRIESKPYKVPSTQSSRFWHFTKLAIGLGAGFIGESTKRNLFGRDENKEYGSLFTEANASRMADSFSRMRGAALKIGQVLSIQDDSLLPPKFVEMLEKVRKSANPIPTDQLYETLKNEFGENWRELFSLFEEKPIAAASIGQVHRAITKDGIEVAVKVQYPGVADSISSDIKNLTSLLKMVVPESAYIDKSLESARLELLLETNYLNEAANQKKVQSFIENSKVPTLKHFYVPKVIDHLTTQKILTTEFVHGVPIDKIDTVNYNQKTRNWISKNLLSLCLAEVFEFGFMQTDPNWTNFVIDFERKRINLLDFGACRQYKQEFLINYFKCIQSGVHVDKEKVLEYSLKLGYLTGQENQAMNDAHASSVLILAEPFSKKHILNQNPEKQLEQKDFYSYNFHEGQIAKRLSGCYLVCSKLKADIDCTTIWDHIQDIFENKKWSN
eukprot:gene2810-3493_t